MNTCVVQMDGTYNYISDYTPGENQYAEHLPLKGKTVDAKYIPHSNNASSNILLDALPPRLTPEEVILCATTGFCYEWE